jgi:hypothetical protein
MPFCINNGLLTVLVNFKFCILTWSCWWMDDLPSWLASLRWLLLFDPSRLVALCSSPDYAAVYSSLWFFLMSNASLFLSRDYEPSLLLLLSLDFWCACGACAWSSGYKTENGSFLSATLYSLWAFLNSDLRFGCWESFSKFSMDWLCLAFQRAF